MQVHLVFLFTMESENVYAGFLRYYLLKYCLQMFLLKVSLTLLLSGSKTFSQYFQQFLQYSVLQSKSLFFFISLSSPGVGFWDLSDYKIFIFILDFFINNNTINVNNYDSSSRNKQHRKARYCSVLLSWREITSA